MYKKKALLLERNLLCIVQVHQLWRNAILSDEMVVAQFGGPMLQAFRTRLTGESVEQHTSPISPESDDADAALMEALEDDGEMD